MMAYSILDLRYHRNGAEEPVYPVVLFGPENVVLADCGYPGSLKLLKQALIGRGNQAGACHKAGADPSG